MSIKETARELCALSGPSGFEEAVALRAKELLTPLVDEICSDNMGNILALRRCGKAGARRLLLDAHLDEAGFIVTEVTEGFLKFSALGGLDERTLPGREVRVLAPEGPLYGVVACLPPHVLTAEQREQAVEIKNLFIDLGFPQEEAVKRVPVGTPGVFEGSMFDLQGDNFVSKALDDRLCAAVVLQVMENLRGEELPCDLAVMFSSQEEVGLRGAAPGAFRMAPDWCIAVDVTHARTPDAPKGETFEAGKGCTVGVGPNANRALTAAIMEAGKAGEIPFSVEVMPRSSGTNGWAIQITRQGVATAIVSVPVKYMHSPMETASLADAEAAAKLITAFIRGGWLNG